MAADCHRFTQTKKDRLEVWVTDLAAESSRGPRGSGVIHSFSKPKQGGNNQRIKTVEKAVAGGVMSTQF